MLVPPHGFQRNNRRIRLWALMVLLSCCGGIWAGVTTTYPSLVSAMDETSPWSVTLHITEASGIGNAVVFGQKPDASDGQDVYDLPEPPAPPQLPYIRAWFSTPFSIPYNDLLQEYKHMPSQRLQWNLSILWVMNPGNITSTTIQIHWDSAQAEASNFESFKIYEGTHMVADMLTQNSYSFPSNGSLYQFQIIAQNTLTNGISEQNTISLPFILFLSIGAFVVIVVIVLFFYRRKK
jgi:hypothetical protein